MSPEQRKSVTDFMDSREPPPACGTLKSCGFKSKEEVRRLLGTPRPTPCRKNPAHMNPVSLATHLPVLEKLLQRRIAGEWFNTESFLALAKSVGGMEAGARAMMYHVFSTVNPDVDKLKEFIAGAKRRIKGR